jgi:squamous cell carcinoma antigen recognized by T-cells 3
MLDATMDEAEALVALANLLDTLSHNPYDIALHAQHISIAAQTGLDDQVHSAREMMTGFWAAGEDVWLPLIEYKLNSTDLNTLNGVSEVLALFDQAEADYLCASYTHSYPSHQCRHKVVFQAIQILRKHLDFLIERYTHFVNLDINPEELGDVFSTEWTRAAIKKVVSKCSNHLTEASVRVL